MISPLEFVESMTNLQNFSSIIRELSPMSTASLRDQVAGIVPLGFLVILLILYIKTMICSASRGNRCALSPAEEADSTKAEYSSKRSTGLSVSYKSSAACSTLVLVAHLLVVLITLNGSYDGFNSEAYALSAEVIQSVVWVIALVVLYRVQRQRPEKFPGILRAWWICNFAASLIMMVADVNLVIMNHDHPRASDFVDFLALVGTTWLFGIAVRGKTGIACLYYEKGTSEPLLREKSDKHAMPERDSPYSKATYLQLVTFSWLNPLFAIGTKKPLEQDDIPDVDLCDSAGYLSQALGDYIKQVKNEGRQGNPLYKAMVLFVRRKAAMNALFAIVCASASYVGPYLIEDFVNFLSNRRNRRLESGYLLALAFLGAKVIETISQRQWIFGARQLGLRLRAALISHIYQKGLRLSSRSRQGRTSGEIINYMSVDIQRITDFMWYLNIVWMLPIQITLAIYVLHMNLGPGSLAALAATLVVMLCNIPLTKLQRQYQSRIMEAKDDRMRTTSEVLRNMKTIKLQAWDNQFLGKLESLREKEYNQLWKSLRLAAITAFIFWGSPTFISVATFGVCLVMNIELTAGRVLSALATFRMLQDPIFNLPDLLNVIAQAKVSTDRIAMYLQEEEIQYDAIEQIPRKESEFDVEIQDGSFAWTSEIDGLTLTNINLRVRRGMKVAICGTVGSGKSSLLSCILGEMQKVSGRVKASGTKAYVPQSPWILSGDIRENILFGNAYDAAKYHETVKACALLKDFELFSGADRTEIGERGINMSGGQKQRIQIARSVYQDANIYLLDDPFSAVDAHTGTQLFSDCLMGILKDKTILYVTHQVEFLPAADLVLVMQDGKIAQAGKFEDLLKQNIGFEALVRAHNEALESILAVENSSQASQDMMPNGGLDKEAFPADEPPTKRHTAEDNHPPEILEKGGKLVQDEERERGSIGKEVYWSYLTMVTGGVLIPIILLAQSSFQVLQVLSNYWIAWASPPTIDSEPALGMNIILLVYALFAVCSSLCILLRATLVAVTGLWTAQKLFTKMLHSVFRAPMSFFDSTPTGRILNRASTDQSVLDLEMAMKLGWCAFSIIQLLGTITVMSQVAWEVFILFIPVTAICIWYQRYYTPTARELARISGIQQTPILHHFAESLAGAATIRAFDQEERFTHVNLRLIDGHSRPWFHNVSAMEWLSFRLNILSNFVFAFSLVLLITLPEGIINPSIAGLAVTYGINLNAQQASVIWNMCNAENKIISVERILQYTKLASEAALVIEDCRPPSNWPSSGTICFKNLQIRYAEHLPSVLKNITCTFPGRRKIGVVGRTGSGKSTLIQAIFRMVEPREGSIMIDDVDICKIGLHDLRSRLSIIPQDPTMFEGTVRGNLDPLKQYSDAEIWETLDKCQLGNVVRAKEEKLDYAVVENGENWSVGQRQLFCLARALLKKSKILVLDEATASVDSATDGVIQKVIGQEFQNQTVVTIAHRIHTVIDSDLVLVLSDGRIAEYNYPSKLLEREDSFFSKLIKEYSMRSQSFSNLAH